MLEVKAINMSSLKDASLGVVVAYPAQKHHFSVVNFLQPSLQIMHTCITYLYTTKLSTPILPDLQKNKKNEKNKKTQTCRDSKLYLRAARIWGPQGLLMFLSFEFVCLLLFPLNLSWIRIPYTESTI